LDGGIREAVCQGIVQVGKAIEGQTFSWEVVEAFRKIFAPTTGAIVTATLATKPSVFFQSW
jgi:hypothetical protein